MNIRKLAGKVARRFLPILTRHPDIRNFVSIIEQEELDHIHYGCWEDGTETMKQAQENLYGGKIRPLLPPHARTVLDIGGGIGGVSNQLEKDGYEPLCVVPDPLLISVGRKRFPRLHFLEGTAEQFTVRDKHDAALLIESYQYFTDKPRAISNIVKHLSPDGRVIMAEEFALTPGTGSKEADLVAQMKSAGYFAAHRVDISEQVLPSCRYIYEQAERRNQQDVSKRWRDNERLYRSGKRCYLLLCFARHGVARDGVIAS